MNLLVDINHPGHVHLLKNVIKTLNGRGHKIFTTVKNIPEAIALLEDENIGYTVLGRKYDSLWLKALTQFMYNIKLKRIVKKNKISIGIGSSLTLALIGKRKIIKTIILDDDDDNVEPLFVKYAHPYASVILTPEALKGNRKSENTIFYPGTHELAYLHPNQFTPDKNILEELNLNLDERYFVLRFNAFKAHHDIGISGLNSTQKIKLVNLLSKFGRVFITGEREIESEFESYRLDIPKNKIHHLIYFSTMFLGDSQTMTSEAATLGVPAMKCNKFAGKLSVPNMLENSYGLCYSYLPDQFDEYCNHIKSLLENPELRDDWKMKRQEFVKNCIDVTEFLIWFIENYPKNQTEINTFVKTIS